MINCPKCKRLMEVCMSKKDKSYYQFLCRDCLAYWDMNRKDLHPDEIRELAQE